MVSEVFQSPSIFITGAGKVFSDLAYALKFVFVCSQIVITVFMNLFSIGLAITAIVLYSNDLAEGPYVYGCEKPERSASRKAEIDVEYRRKLDDYTVCLKSMQTLQVIHGFSLTLLR